MKKISEINAPALAGVIREKSVSSAVAAIKNCLYDGADMIDLHISCLENADENALKSIIRASKLPVLALNYNRNYDWSDGGLTENERIDSLLCAVSAGAAGIAAVASLVLNIYGLSNDYRSFVYSLEDGSGSGQTQLIAMLVLLAVSVIAAIVAVVCGRAYTDAVNGREREKYVRPSEAVAAAQPELDADEEDDDEPVPKPRRRDNKNKKHSAEKLEYTPEPDSIDELTEQTRRLNEEAEKLEAEARRYDYEKARREYEEARRRFEEARRRSEENK